MITRSQVDTIYHKYLSDTNQIGKDIDILYIYIEGLERTIRVLSKEIAIDTLVNDNNIIEPAEKTSAETAQKKKRRRRR